MFPWIAIGLLVLIILLSYVLKWQRGRSISHLPTYTYLPGFGTMYKLLRGGTALHDELMAVSEIMDETNLPFIYWAGTNPIIIIQDPEDLKLVTNAFIEKPSLYNFAKVWLGESVATTTGREWKHDVKGFTKALKRKSVKNYQDVFNTQAKKLVNKLKRGESSNIFSELGYTTFEAICKICTGDSEIPDLIPAQEYHEAISSVLDGVITRMTNILYHPEFLFQRTQTYRDVKKNTAVLHNVSKKLLERYKQNQLAEKNENRDGKGTRAKYTPFLSHFVDIGLSEERIKSEIDILIFAQDPVATALLMIFIIIGARQDIQDKLYNEIRGIFGDSNRDVVNEDMEKMVYCEGVIREALRLYPPGPMALRKIDEEFKIPSCTIPKDTTCFINIWGSGRSNRLWGPDVLEFKPERWVDPDSLPPILAFSSGKRGCVGEKYAYPMLKTLIAHAVRELTFEADLTKIKIKMLTLLVLGVLAATFLLYTYVLKWKMGKNLTHLPTYPYVPVFGNMHLLLGGGKALHKQILKVSDIMDKTNVPFVLWAGTRPIVFLIDPHDIQMVSNNFPEKPYLYDFGKTWVGNGLATAPVYIWKHTVKGFSKALKSRSVRTYQDVYNAQAKKLVDSLKIGEPADAWKKIAYTTFETILLIALGVPEIPDLIPMDEYHEAISNTFEKIIQRILNVLYHPDFVFKCTQSFKELEKSAGILHDTTNELFQKYQQKHLTLNDSESNRKVYRQRFKPLLDHLRDINISERQMKSEIDTLVFAQEPIATAMLIVLLTIGTRQDIQDKLYEEVKEIFGDTKRDVKKEDLEKMVYCEGVIREALRLYPPAPFVLRNIDRDFKIKSCTIPKDGMCLINIYGSSRSTRLWGADASEFKPERWINPSTPLPPLLSFSMGKRRCLGEKYAYHFLKTMIAHVVRELAFEADITKLKIKFELLIRVYEGLDSLKIWQRTNDSERTDGITLTRA